MTEQEQIQELKNWIKSYGPYVLAGIVIALLISTGWRYWQQRQNKILVHASNIYDEMLTQRSENKSEAANIQAKKLLTHYQKTPYAIMSALLLARSAISKNNYPEAEKQLNWVVDHAQSPQIIEITRIRLARLLIAENKPDAALQILEKSTDKIFLGLTNEVRGDAFVAKNDTSSAKNAYGLALKQIPNGEVTRPILQMKYENLT